MSDLIPDVEQYKTALAMLNNFLFTDENIQIDSNLIGYLEGILTKIKPYKSILIYNMIARRTFRNSETDLASNMCLLFMLAKDLVTERNVLDYAKRDSKKRRKAYLRIMSH